MDRTGLLCEMLRNRWQFVEVTVESGGFEHCRQTVLKQQYKLQFKRHYFAVQQQKLHFPSTFTAHINCSITRSLQSQNAPLLLKYIQP